MKCRACKYKGEPAYETYTEGFMPVNFHATVNRPANWGPDILTSVQVWACPKCGTLKIEEYFIHEDEEEDEKEEEV